MSKKIKIFAIADLCLSPSGVAVQTKYVFDALLRSGKFQIRQFGAAIKHNNYQPIKLPEYGDDLIIFPVDGFGTKEQVRSFIRQEKPDLIYLMTDPRFFMWLFEMDNELRPLAPILYWTIWDANPPPMFNHPYYMSCDKLVCISKLTKELVSQVVPEKLNDISYLPHTCNDEIFKPLPKEEVDKFRRNTIPNSDGKLIFFYNGRNARRKATGSMIFWFKEFLDKVGHDKAILLMHTEVHDENGPNLEEIVKFLGLVNGEVLFSQEKIPQEGLATLYNMIDCTLSISEAEGFGIPTLESLFCGKPIIVTMTGGLQEQVTDGKEFFGIGIEPKCQMYAGSQQIPYIIEDRIIKEDFVNALVKFYEMTPEEREELGRKGRNHALTNYGFKEFGEKWVKLMTDVYEECGSWSSRKNYKSLTCKKI